MAKEVCIIFLTLAIFLFGLCGADTSETPPYPRVGILIPEAGRQESQIIRGFQGELKSLGFLEGKSILTLIRNAKGNRGALGSTAAELVAQKVDAIVTTGTRATQAAKAATREIPVIFVHPADPVALGFVKSMTNPEGNLTGVAGLSRHRVESRMEIVRAVYPGARQVLIFYDQNDVFSRDNFHAAEKAAVKLGLKVSAHPVKTGEELKISLTQIQKREGDVLFHIPDNLVDGQSDFFFKTARQKRLPTVSYEEQWAIKGAMATYGPSYLRMGREAARLVDKILKGKKPKDLPVVQADKFDLIVNYRTAYLIGHTLPPEVLKKADTVIR